MFKKLATLFIGCTLFVSLFTGCSGGNTITVGSKNYTENNILGELIAQQIEENSDIKVNRKLNMGGTFVCFKAIKKGQIDIYPEYTGTALTAQLKMPVENDADKVYDIVSKEFNQQFDIKWLKPFGYNNTYGIAISPELAQKNNIKTISDLVEHAKGLTFGAEHEFFNREDGFNGFVKAYGLEFKDTQKFDTALKYQSMADGEMDVTDAFTTDGQLKALNLFVLEDDKNFFPPYYSAPIIRNATLEKYPELEGILNKLDGIINEETMQDLNYKVDNEKQSIDKVAKDFLKEKGLI